MDVWVIGAGGLLGRALTASLTPRARLFSTGSVPWQDPVAATTTLLADVERFVRWRRPDEPWAVFWAAGTAVPATRPDEARTQSHVLVDVATAVAERLDSAGSFVFASSASVYGTATTDCDESTPTQPAGGYAVEKLWQERQLANAFTSRGGARLVLARISTLYGAGQNLLKRQGLVSSMCLEALRGGVITLHAPLDTVRDYLYAPDAAAVLRHLVDASLRSDDRVVLRVVGSHRPTTIGELARIVQSVVHRRTHVVQASVPGNGLTPHLSVRSNDPKLADIPRTPLVVGVKAVHDDVLLRYALGTSLAPSG